MVEVPLPKDDLFPATRPEVELKLRHLPLVVGYAAFVLAAAAGTVVVTALAFVAEMVVAFDFHALVAFLLPIVVPIALLGALKKGGLANGKGREPAERIPGGRKSGS